MSPPLVGKMSFPFSMWEMGSFLFRGSARLSRVKFCSEFGDSQFDLPKKELGRVRGKERRSL